MKTAALKTIEVQDLKPADYNPRKKLKPGDTFTAGPMTSTASMW